MCRPRSGARAGGCTAAAGRGSDDPAAARRTAVQAAPGPHPDALPVKGRAGGCLGRGIATRTSCICCAGLPAALPPLHRCLAAATRRRARAKRAPLCVAHAAPGPPSPLGCHRSSQAAAAQQPQQTRRSRPDAAHAPRPAARAPHGLAESWPRDAPTSCMRRGGVTVARTRQQAARHVSRRARASCSTPHAHGLPPSRC